MLLSTERVDGEPAAVAFGAERAEGSLTVGFIACNARCPNTITLDGTSYRVPSSLLSNTEPQVERNISLTEETNEHQEEDR